MNRHGSALLRVCVAGAVTGVLWGMGIAGPQLAQGGALRAHGEPLAPAAIEPFTRTAIEPFAHAAIVDGSDASITEFPFQVALYNPRVGPPAKGFFCGGVILDATSVATAAHCLINEQGRPSAPAEIEVLAGSTFLEPTDPGSIRDPVAATTVDGAYNPATSDYDVGLLHLARPLWSGPAPPLDGHSTVAALTPSVALAGARSAAVFASQASSEPEQAMVSGWGDLNSEPGGAPSYPRRLHKARVPLVSAGFCEEAYASIEQAITPRMMCAGGLEPGGQGRTDSCYGDSGGPLVAAGGGAPAGDVLLGLVDFGNGCAQAGYPGVYVRIADPAVAHFLGAEDALALAGGIHRGLCPRVTRGGHQRRHARKHPHHIRRCKS
jgi:trypsin